MSSHLCLTIRFLEPYFHGRGDGAEPEWPPSPLRLFQALVNAVYRGQQPGTAQELVSFLQWLEQQSAPRIVAPQAEPAQSKYRLYVPDNVGDKVAKSWSAGREASIADYRTEKDIRPMRFADEQVLHYVFGDARAAGFDMSEIQQAARSITHLGWGPDLVAGNAIELSGDEVTSLSGTHWLTDNSPASTGHRVPIVGTLRDLEHKHAAFLSRVGPDGFRPVPPLTQFRVVSYRRGNEAPRLSWTAFSILKPDASGTRPFDPVKRTRDVAGMIRAAAAEAALQQGWSTERINVFIHGKTSDGAGPATGELSPDRFMYFPLPTINPKLDRIESIRRVMIAAPEQCRSEIKWIRQTLSGIELRPSPDSDPSALLTILPTSDRVLHNYTGTAKTWTTVTPMILPGRDDLSRAKVAKLIRKSFSQAGFPDELVSQLDFEWRGVGFRRGADLANRYLPPENLSDRRRIHLKVEFPFPVTGPIAIGAGRFRGFGLLATHDGT